jgi:riboflavin-specific deaminase-like protein
MAAAKLPFVFINTATTADGKIAPSSRHFVPFSGARDQAQMMELRSRADAVLSGARTVDLGTVDLGPGGTKYQKLRLANGLSEHNLRVIVSGSASLNPDAYIFSTRFSPIILLTTAAAPKARLKRLARRVDDMFISPGGTLDFAAAFSWLHAKWKVKRLLCEGGGEVNAALFEAGLVHELHLTICPLIFGGRNAPTLADGRGVESLNDAIRLRLKSLEEDRGVLFCVFRVQRSR